MEIFDGYMYAGVAAGFFGPENGGYASIERVFQRIVTEFYEEQC